MKLDNFKFDIFKNLKKSSTKVGYQSFHISPSIELTIIGFCDSIFRGEIQKGAQVTVFTQFTKFILPLSYIEAVN